MVLKTVVLVTVLIAATLGAVVVMAANGSSHSNSSTFIISGVSEWGALTRQLVGPDATVVSLLTDPNADPHQHEATVRDAANVSGAAIVVENGAGYDTWLSQLVASSGTKAAVLNVGRLTGVSPGHNPHLFYSVRAARALVRAVTFQLAHRRGFVTLRGRSRTLLAALRGVEANIGAIAHACANVKVASTEDVASYLLLDAKLRIVTPERLRLAVGNGVDPSVQDLATALSQLRTHPAFLIDNVQTATPLTNEIVAQAKASHVPIIKVTETMRGSDYVGFLSGVVSAMRVDLKRQGCLK